MSMRRAAHTIILALAVAAAACGGSEKTVVDQYFRAIQAEDTQTLSSFAAVRFEQKPEAWKILSVTPETRQPAPLPSLSAQVSSAEQALEENKKAYNTYFLDHPNEVDQVRELMKKNADIPAKLQSYAEEWQKFIDKERELKRQLAEAKDAVSHERRNAILSVGQLDDLENLQGELVEKKIDLSLTVNGQAQDYTMTLRKYELESAAAGPRVLSRWMIYDLQPKA